MTSQQSALCLWNAITDRKATAAHGRVTCKSQPRWLESNFTKAIYIRQYRDLKSRKSNSQEPSCGCSLPPPKGTGKKYSLQQPLDAYRAQQSEERRKGKRQSLAATEQLIFFFLFCLWFEWVETLKKSCGIEVFSLLFPL